MAEQLGKSRVANEVQCLLTFPTFQKFKELGDAGIAADSQIDIGHELRRAQHGEYGAAGQVRDGWYRCWKAKFGLHS